MTPQNKSSLKINIDSQITIINFKNKFNVIINLFLYPWKEEIHMQTPINHYKLFITWFVINYFLIFSPSSQLVS